MRRTMLACLVAVGVGMSGGAFAKCAPGEVWGDVGCRPAAKPSILATAVKSFKARRAQKKHAAVAATPDPSHR